MQYGIPLTILSYQELYGWTMDQIVAQVGTKGNCTFCGVFRRQALDRGAWKLRANKVATGGGSLVASAVSGGHCRPAPALGWRRCSLRPGQCGPTLV